MIPCGTRNLVAKSLGLPADVIECCQNFGNYDGKDDILFAKGEYSPTVSFLEVCLR